MSSAQGTETANEEVLPERRSRTGPVSADDGARAHGETAPAASAPSVPRWLVRLGWTLLALQLFYLWGWSHYQYQRYSETRDFASYHQAWYLIGHGDLNPFITLLGFPFWRNGGELLMYPLALLGLPFNSNALAMLWLADLAIVGTGAVAFSWVLDLARRPSWPTGLSPTWAVGTCLFLLIANPWVYWTAAFDFHMETPGAFFLILTARSLERGRFRRCAVWAVLTLLCGYLMAAMTAGLGVAAILAGRKWRRAGLTLVATGVGVAAIWATVGIKGSNLGHGYGYLAGSTAVGASGQVSIAHLVKGVVTHPGRVLGQLWSKRLNILAFTAPSGLVGFLTPWGFGVPLVALVANNLPLGLAFSASTFQYFPLFGFIVVGTAYFLARLTRRHSWGARASKWICVVLLLNALCWSIVWIPQTYARWVRLSATAAAVLDRVQAQIPPDAEVVASGGIVGLFSGRKECYEINAPTQTVPVEAHPVYFVFAPYQGIEFPPANKQLAMLWTVTGMLHARLIASGGTIWAFRWDPPPGVGEVNLSTSPTVPGWALPTSEGKAVLTGPVADWHMASGSAPGYVVQQAYWREPPGRYVATVALASTGPATIEVWNSDSGDLLARRQISGTNGISDVFIDAYDPRNVAPSLYTGSGPFRIDPVPPPPGNQLEVRVFAGANSDVSVYSVELVPKRDARPASRLGE